MSYLQNIRYLGWILIIQKSYSLIQKNIAFSHLSCNISAARQNREGKRESQRKLVVEGRTKRTNLTIETVRNIKTDLATMSRKDVCNKYGITKSTLANIARGETFQYID